jgi:hypothetical protein
MKKRKKKRPRNPSTRVDGFKTSHTYRDATVSLGGLVLPGTMMVEAVERSRTRDPVMRAAKGTYDVNLDMTLPKRAPDPLDDLAWQAVATPSLDASAALDVLADALLERGTISAPLADTPRVYAVRTADGALDEPMTNALRPKSVREQAWAWAKERATRLTFFDKLTRWSDSARTRLPNFNFAIPDPDLPTLEVPDFYNPRHDDRDDDR